MALDRFAGKDSGDESLEGGGTGVRTFNHQPDNLSLRQV